MIWSAELLRHWLRQSGQRAGACLGPVFRIFTVWRCSRRNVTNPVWKEQQAKREGTCCRGEQTASWNDPSFSLQSTGRSAILFSLKLCNLPACLCVCYKWLMLNLLTQRTRRNDLNWIQFWPRWGIDFKRRSWTVLENTGAFQKINEWMNKWRGFISLSTEIKTDLFQNIPGFIVIIITNTDYMITDYCSLISFILHCWVIFFVLFYVRHWKWHERLCKHLQTFKRLTVFIHAHSLWFSILAPSDSPSWHPTFQNRWGL